MKMKKDVLKRRAVAVASAAVLSVSCVFSLPAFTRVVSTDRSTLLSAVAASDKVTFTDSAGYSEGAYVEWSPVSGASGYNVYCDGAQLDTMLVRQYPGSFRADAVGLKAGEHTVKVVPVIGGSEDTSKGAETKVTTTLYDRTGFAFSDQNGACGAYNADGSLKSDAVVVYITEDTKDSVTADVVTDAKGTKTQGTGLKGILDALKKGFETRPFVFRIVGTVTTPSLNDKGDITIDGKQKYNAGTTFEGIGEDAVIRGFGLRLKNAVNVEIRNIGVMLVASDEGDDISLQQENNHIWVHNCDFFYGEKGSDADQAKGDGALDCKTSTYVTFSYNHFWDNGKCNLLGLSEGTPDGYYITYHHNWYDHSDSRHPRVRYYSAHVYNNYYDGNAKYGIGSALNSSIFSENNYFRNCKYPMLTSMQGSDIAQGEGTFSDEDGGVIKAYGNIITGGGTFVPYSEDNTDYDAYVASSADEKVPSSVISKKGSNTYNNFDTGSVMYAHTPDPAEDVPDIVKAKAGRLGGGDFDFAFTEADDESYDVNEALMSALRSYTSSVVAIGSGFKEDTGTDPQVTTAVTNAPADVTTAAPSGSDTPSKPPVTGPDVIYCSPDGTGDGKTIDTPTDVLSAIKDVVPGGTIYLLDGTYKFSETIIIEESNSGSEGSLKTISAYPGAKVVWDFSGQSVADANRGIVLDGSYWYFYGFEITKAGDNGMLLSGDNNKIEMMVFNDNQDTGLQISRYQGSYASIEQWPTNNYILNCTSKDNCDDATMENADGFAAKLTCGEGNVFDGCMSYNNSDDGWDLYAKTETGPTGVVTLKNCIAFRNGYTEFGEGYGDCDGNGFKLGGGGVGTRHIVINCLAFENLNCGFTDNNNPEFGDMTDCTAYNNGVGGNGKANFMVYRCSPTATYDGMFSYINTDLVSESEAPGIKISNDKFVGTMTNSVYYNGKYYRVDESVTMENGSKLGENVTPADSDFYTLEVPAMGSDFHTLWRTSSGTLNPKGFAETTEDSAYASMGYHMYSEEAPLPEVTTTAPKEDTSEQTTTTAAQDENTTSPSQGGSGGTDDGIMYGDANVDGDIDVTDVVAILRYVCDKDNNPLTEEGYNNSDLYQRGDGITSSDAASVQKYLAKINPSPLESYMGEDMS